MIEVNEKLRKMRNENFFFMMDLKFAFIEKARQCHQHIQIQKIMFTFSFYFEKPIVESKAFTQNRAKYNSKNLNLKVEGQKRKKKI